MPRLEFRAWVYYGDKLEKPHYSRDYDSLSRFFEDHDEKDNKQCIEQSTGIKDKNGKEIYEGDIVRIDSMDEIRVGYVELVADQYCIVCGEDEEGNKIVAEFYYYSKPEENCEVIGNIHENPELLEQEDAKD